MKPSLTQPHQPPSPPPCQQCFLHIKIDKLYLPPQLKQKKRIKHLRIKLTIGKYKKQQQISIQQLNEQYKLEYRFTCTQKQILKIEIYRSLTIITPQLYAEFQLEKLCQIQGVQHCVLVELVDWEKWNLGEGEQSGSVEMEIGVYRENIGVLLLKQISLSCLKNLSQLQTKQVHLILQQIPSSPHHPILTPIKQIHNSISKWQQIRLPIFNVNTIINIILILHNNFGQKQIGNVQFSLKERKIFYTNQEVKISDLPIQEKGERLMEFYCVGRFVAGGEGILG